MIAKDHDQVVALLEDYVVNLDNAILIPTINDLMDDDAECVIAIQRASGNEGDRFDEFIYLTIRANFLTLDEAAGYISMLAHAKQHAA